MTIFVCPKCRTKADGAEGSIQWCYCGGEGKIMRPESPIPPPAPSPETVCPKCEGRGTFTTASPRQASLYICADCGGTGHTTSSPGTALPVRARRRLSGQALADGMARLNPPPSLDDMDLAPGTAQAGAVPSPVEIAEAVGHAQGLSAYGLRAAPPPSDTAFREKLDTFERWMVDAPQHRGPARASVEESFRRLQAALGVERLNRKEELERIKEAHRAEVRAAVVRGIAAASEAQDQEIDRLGRELDEWSARYDTVLAQVHEIERERDEARAERDAAGEIARAATHGLNEARAERDRAVETLRLTRDGADLLVGAEEAQQAAEAERDRLAAENLRWQSAHAALKLDYQNEEAARIAAEAERTSDLAEAEQRIDELREECEARRGALEDTMRDVSAITARAEAAESSAEALRTGLRAIVKVCRADPAETAGDERLDTIYGIARDAFAAAPKDPPPVADAEALREALRDVLPYARAFVVPEAHQRCRDRLIARAEALAALSSSPAPEVGDGK